MRTLEITAEKAEWVMLYHGWSTPADVAKMVYEAENGGEILLRTGAKLVKNFLHDDYGTRRLAWFIYGYSSDGSDVSKIIKEYDIGVLEKIT